jgi:type II secretory pathway pseudopilin PulG
MHKNTSNILQRYKSKRRGAALIIALVLLAFLGIVTGTVLTQIIRDRQEARTELIRIQSQQLLRDALRIAEAKRQSDPVFSGETWTLGPDCQPFPGTFQVATRLENNALVVEVEYRNAQEKLLYTTKKESQL